MATRYQLTTQIERRLLARNSVFQAFFSDRILLPRRKLAAKCPIASPWRAAARLWAGSVRDRRSARLRLAAADKNIRAVRPGMPVLSLSAKTGQGMAEFLEFLEARQRNREAVAMSPGSR